MPPSACGMRKISLAFTTALAAILLLAGCSEADQREVYQGRGGEGVAAVVREIAAAQRSVLAKSPHYPQQAIAAALAEAKRRGVEVKVVICGNSATEAREDVDPLIHEIGVAHDSSHTPKGGRVFVIDDETVIFTAFGGQADKPDAETVMVVRDSPELAQRTTTEWQSHARRAAP